MRKLKLERFIFIIMTLFMCGSAAASEKPKNIIMMVSDGFGPAGITMTRYMQNKPLHLDEILSGTIQTYSSNSLVTDSAASATAYATGIKTYNGAVSVDEAHRAHETVLERASKLGMRTGVVVTTEITDATPAAYSAHVTSRKYQEDIASQQIAHHLDLMFGGGRQRFLPKTERGSRTDNRNLLNEAASQGVQILKAGESLEHARLPVIGLFAEGKMNYEIDRKYTKQPALNKMAEKALTLLTADNKNGFFLLIEGSRIDHAGHDNDIAALSEEAKMYDETIASAIAYVKQHPDTLLISTSDHETGGLTVSREKPTQEIAELSKGGWYPEFIRAAQHSKEQIERLLEQGELLEKIIEDTGVVPSTSESESIQSAYHQKDYIAVAELLADWVDSHSRTGWTTHGHTAVDVNLYSFGAGSEHFKGNLDNTEIGKRLLALLAA